MNPFKGYWIVLKDIWIFSRTCQSFLDTKQPCLLACPNHRIYKYIWYNYAFAKLVCICFRFSQHGHLLHTFILLICIQSLSCIHTYTVTLLHSYFNFNFIHSSSAVFTHTHLYDCLNMKQPILICFIGVIIVTTAMIVQCLDLVAYCIVS